MADEMDLSSLTAPESGIDDPASRVELPRPHGSDVGEVDKSRTTEDRCFSGSLTDEDAEPLPMDNVALRGGVYCAMDRHRSVAKHLPSSPDGEWLSSTETFSRSATWLQRLGAGQGGGIEARARRRILMVLSRSCMIPIIVRLGMR
jgi:hypothetical protein